jgi:beta-glucanase (GH16 family)
MTAAGVLRLAGAALLAGLGCGGNAAGPDPADAEIGSPAADAAADRPAPAPARDAGPDARADAAAPAATDAGVLPGWRLVWSDEFDGAEGSGPDPARWGLQIGPNDANNELQYYTARRENVALDGQGNLVVTARREPYMGRQYTSARLSTSGKVTATYGRFEARARLPTGRGMWPAFWMLGADIGQVGWPACGEIDIMENIGSEPSVNHGSLHGPGYSGGSPLTASYRLPGGAAFPEAFHTFAAEWEANVVRFYVDDQLYQTRTPADLKPGQRWAFDHPFFLIVNLAVGGTWPGPPDASTAFPQALTVDYVRVYAR